MTHSNYISKISFQIVASWSFAAMLLATSTIQAGEITAFTWSSGVASVAGVTIVSPPNPNNDDVAGPSPNELFVTQKDYKAVGPVDIEFTVIDSDLIGVTSGVTEYTIIEGVNNGTGLDWSDYEIQLGFGVGAGFVLSTAGDGLDFDSPDFNSPALFMPFFPSVAVTHNKIKATGGVMPNGAFSLPYFIFNIDVPDGIDMFTLRQFPTAAAVPEPSSALLAVLGSAVCVSFFRRKK